MGTFLASQSTLIFDAMQAEAEAGLTHANDWRG